MSNNGDSKLNKPPKLRLPQGVELARTIVGHGGVVVSIAFDSSGQTLASGGGNKVVKLWEAATGRLLHTLEGHKGIVWGLAFDPSGLTLASASGDKTVKLWEAATGRLLRTLEGHDSEINSVAYDPSGLTLASASGDKTVKLWEAATGRLLRTLEEHQNHVYGVAYDPSGRLLASASTDKTVKLWEAATGRLLRTLEAHESYVYGVAYDPSGRLLASGSGDKTVKLWEAATGRLLRTLKGHTSSVDAVAFSSDRRFLASKSGDGSLRVWSCQTWETLAVIPEPTFQNWIPCLAFHPTLPLLVTSGSDPKPEEEEFFGSSELIHFWHLDFDVSPADAIPEPEPEAESVQHTTAKIVLVGESGVGKTGLGWKLAHGEFKEHASTHGQQFWVVKELGTRRRDGTECEAILWDLAGQPDYRLTHALFLDDADLALVLFDPTDSRDPLYGVEFWLKQLTQARRRVGVAQAGCCPTILVGARADRGVGRLTEEEIAEFCRQRGIGGGYVVTSAYTGAGLEELLRRMRQHIAWELKPSTVTTVTFKRIKDYVLSLKESPEKKEVVVSPNELCARLRALDEAWEFTDAEMMTAVGHLANYGYVRLLRTSKGEERLLLSPELLNNLAASFVLEARRNPKGLGSLEENRLVEAGYPFPEMEGLSAIERDILLDSAALLFLEHNVCFRETDPLTGQSYLVFPELINLRKPPLEDEQPTEDGVAYTVSGAVENVYASLVVLLGYTQTFTRTDQWRSQARYVVGDGLICGFRQEAERHGELDFVLYFGRNVGRPVRTLFQGLFESFLGRRNLTVFRFEPVTCPNGHPLDRSVVRTKLRERTDFSFCNDCGERLLLPKAHEPIQLTQQQQAEVDTQRRVADLRTRFEQAVFQVSSYVEGQKMKRPECFISYAWGEAGQERWVERSLATDLQKAGLRVLLDRWENSRIGASVARFVERIEECDYLIVVGTPLYRQKAKNAASEKGSVVAAEWELAGLRLLAAESDKKTVMPVLLAGKESEAFPATLRGKVYADFRDERAYFAAAFDLILSIYNIPFNHQAVADLRESLRESDRP